MNTTVTIIGLILIILTILPIFFLNKTGYTFLKKLTKHFTAIAIDNDLNLDQKEIWGSTCIGIDTKEQKLLYNRGLENGSFELVDLKKIRSCEVIKKVAQHRVKNQTTSQLETLDLKLTAKKSDHSILLNFYDIDNGYVEDFEMNRIEKWVSMINACLTHEGYKKVAKITPNLPTI